MMETAVQSFTAAAAQTSSWPALITLARPALRLGDVSTSPGIIKSMPLKCRRRRQHRDLLRLRDLVQIRGLVQRHHADGHEVQGSRENSSIQTCSTYV